MADRTLSRTAGCSRVLAVTLLALMTTALIFPLDSLGARRDLKSQLRSEISSKKSGQFSDLVRHWRKDHGVAAVQPLLQLSHETTLPEKTRSIALLTAAELAGPSERRSARAQVEGLLSDRSWLVRLSAIKALSAWGSETFIDSIAGRLKDPALVVRSEAAATLMKLGRQNPTAATPTSLRLLSDSLRAPDNYRQGRALWVPQKSLAALIAFRAKSELQAIIEMPRHPDPMILRQAVSGLKGLEDQSPVKTARARTTQTSSRH